jgi:hypothetical protein
MVIMDAGVEIGSTCVKRTSDILALPVMTYSEMRHMMVSTDKSFWHKIAFIVGSLLVIVPIVLVSVMELMGEILDAILFGIHHHRET